MHVELYTDGAAKGNPGNGGYGTILRFGTVEKEISQGFRRTTNNRMELLAVIVGLEQLKSNKYPVVVYSDSKYVVDAVSKNWLNGWIRTNFKGKKNKDLWLRYIQAAKNHSVTFQWIRGHNGHPENERCDQLAVRAAESKNLLIDEEFERIERE